MKKFCYMIMMAASLLLSGFALSSCNNKEEEPNTNLIELELGRVDMSSAVLSLKSKGITELAYLLVESDNRPEVQPNATMIFHDGVVLPVTGETAEINLSALTPLTDYVVYIAAKAAGAYLPDIIIEEFSTTDTSDNLSLLGVDYDGFTLYMKLPQEVKDRGNVLRYKFASLYNYNYFVAKGNSDDAYQLEWNVGLKFGDDEDNMTLDISKDTEYLRDENGELVTDEWTGEYVQLHQIIAPGEPTVFTIGEFSKQEPCDYEDDFWRIPLFDSQGYAADGNKANMDNYWTGYFERKSWMSRSPETLDGEVKIEVSEIGAVNARIRLTPSENVKQYCVWIVEDEEYRTAHLPLLDNNEAYLQWFVTSFDASFFANTLHATEALDLTLKGDAYSAANPETEFHIFVTAGNEDFTAQSFSKKTFKTKPKTHPTPVVQVKAIEAPEGEEESPFEVWYNVKCITKNAVSGYYAVDYLDPWVKEYNSVLSNKDLIMMGNSWSPEEIAQINSDEGYNVSFSSLEGMTTRMGVMLYNDEDTPNDVDAANTPAIADATSGYLPKADRVESPLFESLVGTWTISGNVVEYDWVNSTWLSSEKEIQSKLVISNGVQYPETLPDEVYATYKEREDELKISQEEVTRLYKGFKDEAEAWNARLRGQNRLLCFGFNSQLSDSRNLNAFDAFCDFDYVSYDNITILHDFGPKWYLQINKDGSVTAPFNSARFAPMSAHYSYVMYLGAVSRSDQGYTAGYDSKNNLTETLHFPVTIVDENTIRIEPLMMKGESGAEVPCYPNVVIDDPNVLLPVMSPKYVSALTLTREWAGGEEDGDGSGNEGGSGDPDIDDPNIDLDNTDDPNFDPGGVVNYMPTSAMPSHSKSRTPFSNVTVYKKEVYILK